MIDPTALTKIIGDDPKLHRQFLDKFVDQSPAIMSEIQAAFEAGSAKQVGELGHKFKSSSRAIGANALADLCGELEGAGKAGDWEEIKALHPRLEGLIGAVKAFIENE